MYSTRAEVRFFALFCLILPTVVLCRETKNIDHNRQKRTIGLLFESLASFLNVHDAETTTPITFTTSAPGHHKKNTPPPVQKWPPLDFEITPWVLQAVPPTTATIPTTPPYPTTTPVYPYTEEPNVHAQVIVIPLTDPENHLIPQNEIKKEPVSSFKHGNVNGQYYTGIPSPNNHNTNNYQTQSYPQPASKPQTEIYYWQRLLPNGRIGKQAVDHQPQQQPSQVELQYPQQNSKLQLPQQYTKQIQQLVNLLQAERKTFNISKGVDTLSRQAPQNTLSRVGHLDSRTINEGLSNMAGNDYNRENYDKYRYYIDLEPKLRYSSNNNNLPANDQLPKLYHLEINNKYKNINSPTKPQSVKESHQKSPTNVSLKTDVEIVRSIEPQYFHSENHRNPSDGSTNFETNKDTTGNYFKSPAIEMIKSFEIPNPQINTANKDFLFHVDPDERPQTNPYHHEAGSNEDNISNNGNKNVFQYENKHGPLNSPGEQGTYEHNSEHILDQNNKPYQSDYQTKFDGFNENSHFRQHPNSYNPVAAIENEGFKFDFSNEESIEEQSPFKSLNIEITTTQAPYYDEDDDDYDDDDVRYPYDNRNRQTGPNLRNERLHFPLPTYYNNAGKVSNPNPFLLRNQPTKDFSNVNNYANHEFIDSGIRTYDNQYNNAGNRNYPLRNPNAQLHIFIPDEQSLKRPEKHGKASTAQFHYNSPVYYYQNSPNGLRFNNKFEEVAEKQKFTGSNSPRLPDKIHEQLSEQNEIRRNLVSPPSFDQETDTSEHNVTCATHTLRTKYPCKLNGLNNQKL